MKGKRKTILHPNVLIGKILHTENNYTKVAISHGIIHAVAVFRNSQHSFKIFDSHSRDLHGMPHSFGTCT